MALLFQKVGPPMTRTMYDSINVNHIPATATMVAGYANGRYANLPALRTRFPHATVVSIATNITADAQVLDVEKYDATPDQAPGWCTRQRARQQIPSVYCIVSAWPSVRAAFRAQNIPEPNYWIAHYDNKPELPPGAVAKQYGGNVAGNYDISIVADYWPGVDPIPTPTPTPDIGDPDMAIVFRDPSSQNVFVVSGGKKYHIDRPTLTQLQTMGATHGEPVMSAELTALFPTA